MPFNIRDFGLYFPLSDCKIRHNVRVGNNKNIETIDGTDHKQGDMSSKFKFGVEIEVYQVMLLSTMESFGTG